MGTFPISHLFPVDVVAGSVSEEGGATADARKTWGQVQSEAGLRAPPSRWAKLPVMFVGL